MSENDNDTPRSPRRLLPPQPKTILTATPAGRHVTLSNDVNGLLDDALSVIAMEIIKYKAKTNKGQSLDLSEARVLQGYIKSLVELSKESRERDDASDYANMSDSELFELVEKIKKARLEGVKV